METATRYVQRFVAGLLASLVTATAAPQPSAPVSELNVGLSGLSTETLDPILGGFNVKVYLGQIYDSQSASVRSN